MGIQKTDNQRAALKARLVELGRRLADLAQDGLHWPDGPPQALQSESAELEREADVIRHQLGMPPGYRQTAQGQLDRLDRTLRRGRRHGGFDLHLYALRHDTVPVDEPATPRAATGTATSSPP